jgi:hypothetical protein
VDSPILRGVTIHGPKTSQVNRAFREVPALSAVASSIASPLLVHPRPVKPFLDRNPANLPFVPLAPRGQPQPEQPLRAQPPPLEEELSGESNPNQSSFSRPPWDGFFLFMKSFFLW